MNRNLGIILIVIGAINADMDRLYLYQKKKIIDAGPIQVSVDQKETIGWPPYLGADIACWRYHNRGDDKKIR